MNIVEDNGLLYEICDNDDFILEHPFMNKDMPFAFGPWLSVLCKSANTDISGICEVWIQAGKSSFGMIFDDRHDYVNVFLACEISGHKCIMPPSKAEATWFQRTGLTCGSRKKLAILYTSTDVPSSVRKYCGINAFIILQLQPRRNVAAYDYHNFSSNSYKTHVILADEFAAICDAYISVYKREYRRALTPKLQAMAEANGFDTISGHLKKLQEERNQLLDAIKFRKMLDVSHNVEVLAGKMQSTLTSVRQGSVTVDEVNKLTQCFEQTLSWTKLAIKQAEKTAEEEFRKTLSKEWKQYQ